MDDQNKILREKIREAIKNKKIYETEGVYLIEHNNQNIIAKGKEDHISKREYNISNKLRKNKVNVPDTYGLIRPDYFFERFFQETTIDNYFVTFQKINGTNLKDISGEIGKLAKKLYYAELDKTYNLGICPDTKFWSGHPVFNSEEQKIYLTNFENWYFGSREEINKIRIYLKEIHKI
ncbi:MAG: hypothetical protein ACP5N1_01825 [Candidatus Woesearchaeota archaeon]